MGFGGGGGAKQVGKTAMNTLRILGEKRLGFRGLGGQAGGRQSPPSKPNTNYSENLAQRRVEAGGFRNLGQAIERRPPPFSSKANRYEKLVQSTRRKVFASTASSQTSSGRGLDQLKASYSDRPAQSREVGDGGQTQRLPFTPNDAHYNNRVGERKTLSKKEIQRRFGEAGPEIRRSDPSKRSSSAGANQSHGSTPRFRQGGAVSSGQAYLDRASLSREGGDGGQSERLPFIRNRVGNRSALSRDKRFRDGARSRDGGQSERLPFIPNRVGERSTLSRDKRFRNGAHSRDGGQSERLPFIPDRVGERSSLSRDKRFRHGAHSEKVGPEMGEFRRIGPRNRSSSAVAKERNGTTPQFRQGGAVSSAGQAYPDSNGSRRDDLTTIPKQQEKVVRKYPPRRLEGEKKWQYAVRKKQLGLAGHTRGSTVKKLASQSVDDEGLGNEPLGEESGEESREEWRRKKIGWLCKEIPVLRPRPIVTILNDQRKWIKAEDTKYIIEHLLQIDQTLRAHRVLKWEMQQPWYEFNFELSSKVAVQLGQNNKLSRTRDIYDSIIKNGQIPNSSTYEVLINCYVVDGENAAMTQAWSLYNQMIDLGGHEPPPTLSYNLFQGLVQKGLTFVDEADKLLKRLRMSGLVCSTEMYSLLIHAHGTKGNNNRIDELINEMKETGLPVGRDVFAAILRSCAKDGNVAVGEQAFADLKMTGQPIPSSVYSSLIKMYGKAGLPEKAFQIFEETREVGMSPTLTVYEAIIEAAVSSDDREQAEKLVKEAQERGVPALQSSYSSVMELYCKRGLLDELGIIFDEMVTGGYPPHQATFNILLEAYVSHRLIDKAEAVFEDMKRGGKVKPNKRTYELMIKLYGEAKSPEKIKEIFKELADKKLDVPEEASRYLEAVVSPKQLEAQRNSKLKLKREQREILAGVLLAGAGVESHDKNRTYEFHFGLDPDSGVSVALINHLYQEFASWSTGAPEEQPSLDPKNPKGSQKTLLAFQTISHGSFRFFAHQYRPNHSPVIPRLVHRWLTPRALAYWYMYGGSKCEQTGGIILNASAYSEKDIMLVVNALKSRSITCEKKRTSSGLAICFYGSSATWLWGLMEPFILPDEKALLKPEHHHQEEASVHQL